MHWVPGHPRTRGGLSVSGDPICWKRVKFSRICRGVILLVYRARLNQRIAIIKSAPDHERVEAIATTAEFFRVNVSGLSRPQREKIVLAQIQARSRRDLLLAGSVLFVAVLLAIIALAAIFLTKPVEAREDQNWSRDYAILVRKNKTEVTVGPGTAEEFMVVDRADLLKRLNSLSLIGESKLQSERDDLVKMIQIGPGWNASNPWSVRYSNEMQDKLRQLRLRVRSIAATKGVDVEKIEQTFAPEPKDLPL
jgi:hypothetical protein